MVRSSVGLQRRHRLRRKDAPLGKRVLPGRVECVADPNMTVGIGLRMFPRVEPPKRWQTVERGAELR